jgi:hypothetical protein
MRFSLKIISFHVLGLSLNLESQYHWCSQLIPAIEIINMFKVQV